MARATFAHRHTFYEIVWISGGGGLHHIDFTAHPVYPDTLYFVAPGQVQLWEIDRPLAGYIVLFTHEFLLHSLYGTGLLDDFAFFSGLAHPLLRPDSTTQTARVRALLTSLYREYTGEDYARAEAIRGYLALLLIEAHRCYLATHKDAGTTTGRDLIRRYLQLIEAHHATHHAVRDYAALLDVSPDHLNERVREIIGITAGALIRQRLLIEAKRLLTYTECTVAEIAHDLHFADPAYFGRFFRREAGVSPGTFHRAIREKYHDLPHESLES